ncbi:hypothetical protein SAMN05421813_11111 [Daejeonella rubra]|uniref:Uncharacterized protein n=1 Tax=Daejeonella rubra TaxID=990371 RepID=A0A1G9SSJ5_9SPHI|nr:hypothetical protein [Daejeonella rubra]SDM38307.1 hypothetical protein SAMN05421813_11111 [Daejeonella rubra]
MNEITYLFDIVKYTLSGLLVFFAAWYFVKPLLLQNLNFQRLELKKAGLKHTLPLRLQAYERTVLFLERINPANLLVRLHVPGMSAVEMHKIIIADIRSEYQHNISQQIYVTEMTWTVVKKIKEETIGIISSTANALPAEASSMDLSKSVLTHLANLESENPYDVALGIVKRDIQSLF